MKKNKHQYYFVKLNGYARTPSFSTEMLFRETPVSSDSPIDTYVSRNRALITKIGDIERAGLLDKEEEDDRHIYNLFLLGFVSNVESYLRSIIREVINLDSNAYNQCLEAQVTYAAAFHHSKELLPEAILENCTFISQKNIQDTVQKYTGITLTGNDINTKEIEECLKLFEQLCQLRHCIVHRAGFLGSKNAIKLGINEHKNFFEKPITLNYSFLQSCSEICLNTVRTINTFLFNKLFWRYVENNDNISWKYPDDRKWFDKYFKLFTSVYINTEIVNNGGTPITRFYSYDKFRNSFLKKP